jgi:tRNA G18 (ribose-2'-O)-methylase SpoU
VANLTLIGDGIENPANVATLANAAAMFSADLVLHERGKGNPTGFTTTRIESLSATQIATYFSPLIALENGATSSSIYGFHLPHGPRPALVAGNERYGIGRDLLAAAQSRVEIPMFGRRLDTLNVGAAAAVALYYLMRNGGQAMKSTSSPARRRPEVLLLAPSDHIEAGSTIRSAGAFGWEHLLLEDRLGVWFGVERARVNEARAAARRSRNPYVSYQWIQRPSIVSMK